MSPLNINGWASRKMWVTVATFSLSQSYMQTQNTERKSQNFFSLYFHCNLLSIPRFELIVIGDWS